MLGNKIDATHPDEGGSSFYVDGVHYFPNGFIAAADVNVTSNLAYRQQFSDSIQQAISPEERSQVFVNKDHNEFSLRLHRALAGHLAAEFSRSHSRVAQHHAGETPFAARVSSRGFPFIFLLRPALEGQPKRDCGRSDGVSE